MQLMNKVNPIFQNYLQSTLILLLLIKLSAAQMRDWPVPALPLNFFQGNFTILEINKVFDQWSSYIYYLCIVFVSPIVFSLLLYVFAFGICCLCTK